VADPDPRVHRHASVGQFCFPLRGRPSQTITFIPVCGLCHQQSRVPPPWRLRIEIASPVVWLTAGAVGPPRPVALFRSSVRHKFKSVVLLLPKPSHFSKKALYVSPPSLGLTTFRKVKVSYLFLRPHHKHREGKHVPCSGFSVQRSRFSGEVPVSLQGMGLCVALCFSGKDGTMARIQTPLRYLFFVLYQCSFSRGCRPDPFRGGNTSLPCPVPALRS